MEAHLASLLKHLRVYTPINIDEAPDGPGLYAWYARLDAGEQDWQVKFVDGQDVGAAASRRILQRYTSSFANPPLRLSATGTFSVNWDGELRDRSAADLEAAIADVQELEGVAKDYVSNSEIIRDVLDEGQARRQLFGVLDASIPFLASPLYVGMAREQSLRQRLRQHVDQLFKLNSVAVQRPGVREELASAGKKTFAVRAVAAGFGPDNLCVWTLDVASLFPDEADERRRNIIRAAEWLLNRWYRPILGVR